MSWRSPDSGEFVVARPTDDDPLHPLKGADGAAGRVITALDPDGYVLVDGLLLRAVSADGQARSRCAVLPGTTVHLIFDSARNMLTARAADLEPELVGEGE